MERADRRAALFDVVPGDREVGKYYDGWKLLRFDDEESDRRWFDRYFEYAMTHLPGGAEVCGVIGCCEPAAHRGWHREYVDGLVEERVSICEADGLSAEAVERAVEHTRRWA
ncbi:MAG: hypothetical protein IT454_20875 [Planctomycetes bacterium]|nr:hypothetical protein [Planctomycetota bacterium]